MTRHEARACALQALYQMDVGKAEALLAIAHVLEEKQPTDADLTFIRTLVEGSQREMDRIDELIANHVEGWRFDRIGRIELNVLRLAIYELLAETQTDAATILDEAVELAKEFGAVNSGKFVNGVLAKLLPMTRPSAPAVD